VSITGSRTAPRAQNWRQHDNRRQHDDRRQHDNRREHADRAEAHGESRCVQARRLDRRHRSAASGNRAEGELHVIQDHPGRQERNDRNADRSDSRSRVRGADRINEVRLPDYLTPGLRVVFCGSAVGNARSLLRGPGNSSGLTSTGRRSLQSHSSRRQTIALSSSASDRQTSRSASPPERPRASNALRRRGLHLEDRASRAAMVAFHGKEAAKAVKGRSDSVRQYRSRAAVGHRNGFGVCAANASGANRDANPLEGKTDRVESFKELARRCG
jgi:hypothetical protein